MKQVGMARRAYRFPMSTLVERKALLTKMIAIATIYRNASVGIIAIAAAHFFDKLFSTAPWVATNQEKLIAICVAVVSIVFVISSWMIAKSTAEKELLSDILSLRVAAFSKGSRK